MAQNLYFEMHVQWAREIWKRMAPPRCPSDLTCICIGHGTKVWSMVISILADCLWSPLNSRWLGLCGTTSQLYFTPGSYRDIVSHGHQGSRELCPFSTSRRTYLQSIKSMSCSWELILSCFIWYFHCNVIHFGVWDKDMRCRRLWLFLLSLCMLSNKLSESKSGCCIFNGWIVKPGLGHCVLAFTRPWSPMF